MPLKLLPNSVKKSMLNHTESMRTKSKINATVLHGNCASLLDQQNATFGDVDLTFLDPPFNQDKGYNEWDDNLPEAEYWEWMGDVCKKIYHQTTLGGAIYFMQREKKTESVLQCLRESGWLFQNLIIWKKKTSAVPGKIVHTATRHLSEKSSMNTGFRGVLPMYDIFGCVSDFAHNFRHLMPTTLNCGATNVCCPRNKSLWQALSDYRVRNERGASTNLSPPAYQSTAPCGLQI